MILMILFLKVLEIKLQLNHLHALLVQIKNI